MTPVVCLSVCLRCGRVCLLLVMCLISLSSLVVMGEALLSDSEWETVEPLSFSFSRKRQAFLCGESRRHDL